MTQQTGALDDPNAPVHIDLGECPKCKHSVPLTEFLIHNDPNAGPIVAKNNDLDEATRLVHELTDKLASIVQIESQIRKLIEHYSQEATTPKSMPVGISSISTVFSTDSDAYFSPNNSSSNIVKIQHKTQVSQLLQIKGGHSPANSGTWGAHVADSASEFDLKNLDASGQAALALLDTHENVTFKLTGAAMVSPQEKLSGSAIDKRMTEFGRKFFNQYFMIGINKRKQTFVILSKSAHQASKAKGMFVLCLCLK